MTDTDTEGPATITLTDLTRPDVIEAAQRAYTRMQSTRDDDPAWQPSMVAALTAAWEAL